MQRLLLLLFFICIVCCDSAAQQSSWHKPSVLGINFTLLDFSTPQKIKSDGFAQLFSPAISRMKAGLAINYMKGVSDHFDIAVSGGGTFVDYPIKNKPAFGKNHLLLDVATMVHMKWFTDKNLFTPYLALGAGISHYEGYVGASIPAGIGLQLNFNNEIYLLLQSKYAFAITNAATDNLCFSIGIAGNLRKPRKKSVLVKAAPQAVNISLQDRDGDGISDANDKCPTIAGTEKYDGCPVPDTDNDGINDEEDRCPADFGFARYGGCPIPDTDGDGINDESDKCINDPGLLENRGCPVMDSAIHQKINSAATKIFFQTGKAILLKESFSALDTVAGVLLKNTSYKINIEGHTDNIGNSSANQILSEERANAVKSYLMIKGVESIRMIAKGFGQDKPVADNKTELGRSINRRVELKLESY